MRLTLFGGLPYVSVALSHRSQSIALTHVLVDTGSGGTVFAADRLIAIGIVPEPQDAVRRIAGVGGAEYVFEKKLDQIVAGELAIRDFRIEVGALDYGFEIDGILGIDFLRAVGAKIDLKNLTLSAA